MLSLTLTHNELFTLYDALLLNRYEIDNAMLTGLYVSDKEEEVENLLWSFSKGQEIDDLKEKLIQLHLKASDGSL